MFSEKEKLDIIEYYNSGFSLSETGVKFDISLSSVYYLLKKRGVKRRTLSVANSLKWTDEEREKQSKERMGKPSGALDKSWKLKHIKKSPNINGENNPNWKGGKTKTSQLIRSSAEYSFWRKQIFERDNYTCQICNRRNKKGDKVIIEADHIYPFYKIIDDFNITSIEEAISCKEFWDVDNGRTLCRECHKKNRQLWEQSIYEISNVPQLQIQNLPYKLTKRADTQALWKCSLYI